MSPSGVRGRNAGGQPESKGSVRSGFARRGKSLFEVRDYGVGDGNRTRNNRSHSPVLCQLSYSHRMLSIIHTRPRPSDFGPQAQKHSGRADSRSLSDIVSAKEETSSLTRFEVRVYPRPMPTYSNPMARRRTESSRFLVSTISGRLSRCLMRSKSRARNSGQPVPTTSASTPSAAA